jgi:hypothetical protein
VDGLGLCKLDHIANVLEHDVAARALRQAIRHLLRDDLVLIGCQAFRDRVGNSNRLHRHLGLIEERNALSLAYFRPLSPASVLSHCLRSSCGRLLRLSQRLAQTQLRRVLEQRESLALAAEELSLEPGNPMLERLDTRSL